MKVLLFILFWDVWRYYVTLFILFWDTVKLMWPVTTIESKSSLVLEVITKRAFSFHFHIYIFLIGDEQNYF